MYYKNRKIALKEIYFLAQGGTAVGTGLNTRKNFDKKLSKKLARLQNYHLGQLQTNLLLGCA